MQLWATGDWQLYHNTSTDAAHCAEFFGETSSQPDDSAQLQHRFGTLQLLSFPKTKVTFEREEISGHWWDSGKYHMAADGEWENCVRSQGAYFERDWGVIVLCPIFLVSCFFFSKWLFFILHGWIHSGKTSYFPRLPPFTICPSLFPFKRNIFKMTKESLH